MTERILFILTSHGVMGETGQPTGFYWEELAIPYWRLHDAGFAIDIASVQGGRPPADPGSDPEGERPAPVQRFMDDEQAMDALHDSRPIAEVDATGYAAVFLPGGHGTMWDLSQSGHVGKAVVGAYEAGAVVGAVCHGPAGLIGATLPGGQPLVQGKRVNGFTDAEEKAANLADVVPFLLETRLRELGGLFEGNPDNFEPHAVRDGRLVTGQNPNSSAQVASLMLEALQHRGSQSSADAA